MKTVLTTTESPAEFLKNTQAITGFRDGVVNGLNSQGANPVTSAPYTRDNVIVNGVTQKSSVRRSLSNSGSLRRLAASLEVDYSIKIEVMNVDSSVYQASSGFAAVFADVTTKVSSPTVSAAVTTSVSTAGNISVTAADAIPPASVTDVKTVVRSSSPQPTAAPTEKPEKDKRPPLAAIGGGVAGVVVCIIGARYFSSRSEGSSSKVVAGVQ